MTSRVVVIGLAIVLVCARRRAGGSPGLDGDDRPSLRVSDPDEGVYVTSNGSNITITCTGVNFAKDYQVYWSIRKRIPPKTITSAAEKTPSEPAKYQVSRSYSNEEDKFQLNVTSITQQDKGLYICSTYYSGRSIEGAVEVRVEDVPFLHVFANNISASIGGMAGLSCEASAVPPIQDIIWQRNGETINNGTDERFYIFNRGSEMIFTKLVILNVTSDDEGVYTCIATNDKGWSSRKVALNTIITNYSDAAKDEALYQEMVKIVEPSHYKSNVVVMGTLRVTCLVTGFPYQPKMYWEIVSFGTGPMLQLMDSEERHYDDVTITTYVMENATGFYYNLMYYPVMYNNTGSYTCLVPHHAGVDKDTINITVSGAPMVVASQLSTYGLLGHHKVVLSCSICANPAPTLVLWYFNDLLISASSRINQSLTKVNSVELNATLTINTITENDFGTYTCKAYNSIAHGMAVQVIQDVDECSFDHDCDHGCENGLGTYTCTCDNGYKLQADSKTCQDVNECQLTEKVACEQQCTNYNGSFLCSCHDGWVLDDNGKTCTNTNDNSGESPDDEAIQAEEIYSIVGATSGALLIIILLILCIVWCRRKKDEEEMPMKAVYSVNTGYSGSSSEMNMTKYHSTNTKDTKISPADEFPRQRLQLGIDLGQGRFGKVMMARALNVSGFGKWEMVAVKTCRDSASDLEKEDLYQELEIMRSIDKHPNIVSYLGCCTKQDPLYILMEYVPGGNLQSQLRKCRPSQLASSGEDINTPTVKELETHALHVAKGMVYLSSIGIIHRDLAARNILVGPNRIAKICDFGLARDVEGSDMYERTSKGPSPIRWMAPESLSDQCFTRKSDVWSFGVLLWEIVTLGATPYPGMTAREVIKSVLIGKWLQCPLHCQQEQYSLMTRCWDMEPKERPSFSEIAKELEVFIESETDYLSFDNLEESEYGVLDPDKVDERV
ncbi:vascular endothelial growth factor receptor 1-like [Pecten maximus]|uniref:vascular endothelial growth factor receptor 1-like n=1 Tax=Pecten maximus TaxID=6579 RepID=UPI001458FAC4|nr:vascular endothelial growth factor receptor 1-like [Pecten maximus]